MKININTPLKLISQLIIGLSVVFSSSLCFAGIYKWVDEQGKTHYGQQRPSNTSVEKMDVQMHAPNDDSSYNRPGQKKTDEDPENPDDPNTPDSEDKEADEKKAEKPPEKPPESAAAKKQRLAACAQARKTLATMQAAGRVRSKDKDGNINYLSDKQKNSRIKTTRDLITKRCK